MGKKITRRAYLIRKALFNNSNLSSQKVFSLTDTVDNIFKKHPEWDPNERKTWAEWEAEST